MFSLSLSARFFTGDRLFTGDRRGWSRRAASGARADSMAAAKRAAPSSGSAKPPHPPFISPSNLAPERPADLSQPAPRPPPPAPALPLAVAPAGAPPPIVAAAAGGKDPPFALAPAERGEKARERGGPAPAAPRVPRPGAEFNGGHGGAAPPGSGKGKGERAKAALAACSVRGFFQREV